jgi:hypothetical protein
MTNQVNPKILRILIQTKKNIRIAQSPQQVSTLVVCGETTDATLHMTNQVNPKIL